VDIFSTGDRLYHTLSEVHPHCDFLYLPEASSTNTRLKSLCQRGRPARPAVLYTDLQTAGRGTRGRVWYQPAAELQRMGLDLALSIAVPQAGPRLLNPRLSLLVGALLALMAERVMFLMDMHPGGEVPPVWHLTGLKWPNDLLVPTSRGWRKAGGILIETVQDPLAGRRWVIIGAGANVNSLAGHFPPELAGQIGTLREWRACQAKLPVAEAFLERGALLCNLANELVRFTAGDGLSDTELLHAWQARDRTAGTRYTFTRDGMARQVSALQVDPGSGGLWVADTAGQRWLVSSYTELSAPE
jgi:biotin-(acetyl-CoA carboxylase) ligase